MRPSRGIALSMAGVAVTDLGGAAMITRDFGPIGFVVALMGVLLAFLGWASISE